MSAVRFVRVLAASALAMLALAACVPANASGATVLIVSPSSIRAGFAIEVRATCSDNNNPAFVSSAAFDSITLEPDHGLLMSEVTIPSDTFSGTYNVDLECASGGHSTAKLTVLNGAHPNPHRGPETGGGEMASLTGAHLALAGGIVAIAVGVLMWVLVMLRRRTAVK